MANTCERIRADGSCVLEAPRSHHVLQAQPYARGLAYLIKRTEITVQGHVLCEPLISNVPRGRGSWISIVTRKHIILPLNPLDRAPGSESPETLRESQGPGRPGLVPSIMQTPVASPPREN